MTQKTRSYYYINLTLQYNFSVDYFANATSITGNYIARAGFELASSDFLTAVLPIELSSQLGLVASLIQFKCTKYFRDDLTLVFEDAQCFNSISEPSSEI